jgi:hypothetical protein
MSRLASRFAIEDALYSTAMHRAERRVKRR